MSPGGGAAVPREAAVAWTLCVGSGAEYGGCPFPSHWPGGLQWNCATEHSGGCCVRVRALSPLPHFSGSGRQLFLACPCCRHPGTEGGLQRGSGSGGWREGTREGTGLPHPVSPGDLVMWVCDVFVRIFKGVLGELNQPIRPV